MERLFHAFDADESIADQQRSAGELEPFGVTVVSLWPGLVRTERIERFRESMPDPTLKGSESPRFTGRAVVALAADPAANRRTGRAFACRGLADNYGFTDVDGSLPRGPLHDRPSSVG